MFKLFAGKGSSGHSQWKAKNTVLLSKLSEEAITNCLQKRFSHDLIYSWIGHVLISVNPFTMIRGMYGEEVIRQYHGRNRHEVPPHVYALADHVYNSLLREQMNQAIIITGESGAGKTEASKLVMQHIAAVSGKSKPGKGRKGKQKGGGGEGASKMDHVKDVILKSNDLLESFGNAKTLRNNNSSRFGKYFQIEMTYDGLPDGGRITNFLLEKTRVVSRLEGERSFHVFYQLLHGATDQEMEEFQLYEPKDFAYLYSDSGEYTVKGIDDAKEWKANLEAMDSVHISADDKWYVKRTLAAILHMGNVEFQEEGGQAYITDYGYEVLGLVASFLEVDMEFLAQKLLTRLIQTGIGSRGSVYNVPNNLLQATEARNSLAMAIYSRLFDYIVDAINREIVKDNSELAIGLLDIYGFEVFDRNTFDQLMINYVNEKLQQIFIDLTLKAEQEEYVREGIEWTEIKYFNNKIVCDLIESKRPPGIFSILDDVCYTMHSVTEGVDEKFCEKLDALFSGHRHYISNYPSFVVKHYAGDVCYDSFGFVAKNNDKLPKDLVEVMKSSQCAFILNLFPEQIDLDSKKRPITACAKMRSQAEELIKALRICHPHYIRTIKPNDNKRPQDFDYKRVRHQVQYLGLLENIRIRRAGFADRQEFGRFLKRYDILSKQTYPRWRGADYEGCRVILNEIKLKEMEEWQMGNTKIFLRHPESIFKLEELRERKYHGYASTIQRVWRAYAARKYFSDLRDSAAQMVYGNKERRRYSLSRMFRGDYLVIRDNTQLQAVLDEHGGEDETPVFTDHVNKYDRRFRKQQRLLVLTDGAIYLIGLQKCKEKERKGEFEYVLKRRLPLSKLAAVSMSTMADNFVVLHPTSSEEHGNVIETPRKTEFVATLKSNAERVKVQFSAAIGYRIKGGKSKTLMFRSDPSQPEAGVLKRGAVLVPPGLPATSKPGAPASAHPTGLSGHRQSKSGSRWGGALQGAQHAREPVAHGFGATVGGSGGDRIKALYSYQGTQGDELTFEEGDEMELVRKDDNDWWTAKFQGREGAVPACYVEVIKAPKQTPRRAAPMPRGGRGGVSRGGVSRGGVSRRGVSRGGVSRGGVSRGVSRGGVSRGVSRGGVSRGGGMPRGGGRGARGGRGIRARGGRGRW